MEDCLAARPKPLRCSACPDSGAACGRDIPPATVKLTGVDTIDLSVPDGCPTTMTLAARPPEFKGPAEYEFALDGADGPRVSVLYGTGPGGHPIASVSYQDASQGRLCYGSLYQRPSNIQIEIVGKYIVTASGRLMCQGDSTWHPFTYRASWTP